MRDINSMSSWNDLAPNSYNSVPFTVRFSDKGHAIKGLVVCSDRDPKPLDLLNCVALGCYQPSFEVWFVYTDKLTIFNLGTARMNFFDLANLLDNDGNLQNEMMVMSFAATMLATIPVR